MQNNNGLNSQTIIGLVIGAIVIAVLIFNFSGLLGGSSKSSSSSSNSSSSVNAMQKDKSSSVDAMSKDSTSDAMSKSDSKGDTMMSDKSTSSASDAMMKKGSFVDYNQSLLANAKNGKVVLFFSASWCPTCKSLNADINSKLSAIPANLTILKLDYDKETELKKKYGVTSQHTLVEVDESGNLIKKTLGLPTLESIVAYAN